MNENFWMSLNCLRERTRFHLITKHPHRIDTSSSVFQLLSKKSGTKNCRRFQEWKKNISLSLEFRNLKKWSQIVGRHGAGMNFPKTQNILIFRTWRRHPERAKKTREDPQRERKNEWKWGREKEKKARNFGRSGGGRSGGGRSGGGVWRTKIGLHQKSAEPWLAVGKVGQNRPKLAT